MSITLVIGGARSGKSTLAEKLARASRSPVRYVATYLDDGQDSEMAERLARHRAQRPAEWETVENRQDLVEIAKTRGGKFLLLDCLTVWLAGCLWKNWSDEDLFREVNELLEELGRSPIDSVLVANEVGLGLVPEHFEDRRFRDLAGWINQRVAAKADRVVLVVAGIPLKVKGELVL